MRRIGSVIGLAEGAQEEYERLHRAVWPEVLAQIKRSKIQNYSIYRYGDLLFSYFEYVGSDFESDMAAMGEDSKTKEWWALTIPLQSPMDERKPGEWWMELPELFHMD
jgi:L-rhamnose mutarotase